ncbi:MAG: MFS transporter [Anaerolineae bacterium]|nr:MFS transporter [Anaerolineae bacterium]
MTTLPDTSTRDESQDEKAVFGPNGPNSAVAWSRRTSMRAGLGMRPPRTFSALRHRNFRLFWFGGLISVIGTWMQIVAQGWLVYELTGSSLLLGVVSFVGSMPTFFFSIPAGVWVDRYNRRTILMATQTVQMLLAFALALLTWLKIVEVWHIVVLSGILGFVNAIDAPARQASIQDMTSREDLMNAIALNSTMNNLARVVGPSIAAAAVAITGTASAFLINGISFLAMIGALFLMRFPPFQPNPSRASMWHTALEGLGYIRTHPTILAMISLMGVSSLFGMSYNTLMPVWAGDVLKIGVTGYGWLMTAIGVGAVIAGLALASLGNFRAKGALLTIGSLVFPLSLLVMAFSRWLPLTLLALVIVGWGTVSQGALTNTLIQSTVPDELRGRVLSIFLLTFFGFMPLGSLVAGFVAERFSPPTAIILGAAVTLAFALFVVVRAPRLRALE